MPTTQLAHARPHFNAGEVNTVEDYRVSRPKGRNDWLLFYTLVGSGAFRARSEYHLTQRGEVAIIPPGSPHDYGLEKKRKRWHFIWAHFQEREHWAPLLDLPAHPCGIRKLKLEDPTLRKTANQAVHDMISLYRNEIYRRDEKAMNALERLLIWIDCSNPRSEIRRYEDRIERVMRRIANSPREKHTVSNMAKFAGLSPSRFSHIFSSQVGQPFTQYLENARLENARGQLSSSTQSISEIAHANGFDDPLYFSKRFKRAFGASPRTFRKAAITLDSATRHT